MSEPSRRNSTAARYPNSHRRPAVLTRRALLGAGVAVLAGGVGAAVAGIQPTRGRDGERRDAPVPLGQALAREQALVADLEAALSGGLGPAIALQAARNDHLAHAATLRSTIARYAATSPSSAPPPSATTPTVVQLRDAEVAAARAAASESAALAGAHAALLASIAASEATHAELLA
jgi:hypothetical protein